MAEPSVTCPRTARAVQRAYDPVTHRPFPPRDQPAAEGKSRVGARRRARRRQDDARAAGDPARGPAAAGAPEPRDAPAAPRGGAGVGASGSRRRTGGSSAREVGYHVRFERKIGPQTRLRVLTEGILTRQLLDDPFLEGVGGVVLDEFHERSLHTDLAVALLREVQQTVRDDLMLVVMSATLDAEPVARFLGDCPIVRGRGGRFRSTSRTSAEWRPAADRGGGAVQSRDTGVAPVRRPGLEAARRDARARRRRRARLPPRRRGDPPDDASGSSRSPQRARPAAPPAARPPAAEEQTRALRPGAAAEGHPRDQHRRDVADDRRRRHGDRQRPARASPATTRSAGSTGWS